MTDEHGTYHHAPGHEAEPDVGEQIARAIEAGVLPSHPNQGFKDGMARAAQIAREYVGEGDL